MIQPIRPTERRKPSSAHARLFGTGDLNRGMRCSVIVAHPADEVVGAGCLISKLAEVSVLHITDGAPPDMHDVAAAGFNTRSEYAQARREECIAALSIANVPEERVVDLAIADQGAAQCLTELSKKIATFLQQTGANIVLTHPYEGAHPDHDATAFATHAALRLMKKNGFRPPVLFEMALHPSADWKSKVPEFLPGSERETTTLLLDERAQQLKRQMFDCFESQRASLEVSPLGPEKFRQPPPYNFNAPPQDGPLHYENLNLAFTSEDWHRLAGNALAELFPAHRSTATSSGSAPA